MGQLSSEEQAKLSKMSPTERRKFFEDKFGDRPDLLAKVVPHYPVGAKRMVRDNGVWKFDRFLLLQEIDALQQSNEGKAQ